MNAREFDLGYTRLSKYFAQKENSTRYDQWYDRLRLIPGPIWEKAVEDLIDGERTFPTLGSAKAACRANGYHPDLQASEDPDLLPEDRALGSELIPFLIGFARHETSLSDFQGQLCFLAQKHKVHGRMFAESPCPVCEASHA